MSIQSDAWNRRYAQWLEYTLAVVRAVDSGSGIPLGPSVQALTPPAFPDGTSDPKVVFCAPHPDDESLSGALALRLRLQGAEVTNVAVTLGSDLTQRQRRSTELEASCRVLGYKSASTVYARRGRTPSAAASPAFDAAEIPAFLRKQAD